MNDRIKQLQERLNKNMDKAVKLAEKNTIRNENGEVVFTKDEIDEMEEYLGLDRIKPISINSNDISDFENWYNEELYNLYNTYKVVNKETARKAMEDCTKKYNNALKNLA